MTTHENTAAPETGAQAASAQSTAPAAGRARFRTLTVSEVRSLTEDSVEVTFAVPPELAAEYNYVPGQYVALRKDLEIEDADGQKSVQQVRRSYSICAAPRTHEDGSTEIRVGIKRDLGGLFSNWANDNLAPGERIEVMSPSGHFTSRHGLTELNDPQALEEALGEDEDLFLAVAAGSGITPIMAIARHLLATNPKARLDIIYANKSTSNVMFLEELGDLKDRYPSRLAVHHVLSREQRISPLLSGRLDDEKIRALLENIVRVGEVDEFFLCGPFELVQLVRDTLSSEGVDAEKVRFELFNTGTGGAIEGQRGRAVVESDGGPSYEISFNLDGLQGKITSPVAAKETILNAALRARPDVPFACAGGVCGTCRAKVVSGTVEMDENYALEPDEIEKGYVLTCQSRPTSEAVTVDYDA